MTTTSTQKDDDEDLRLDLWGVVDHLVQKGKARVNDARNSKEKHIVFHSLRFEALNAYDRTFVLQRVRGQWLEESRDKDSYRLFWLPGAQKFLVATQYPISLPESDADHEKIPMLYSYIRHEITREGGSFREGGVLTLRDVIESGNAEHFEYIATQLDGQTREVNDGSNATFTLKWHRSVQQIEVRVSGRLASE